jgi:hypothetical protein
MDIHARFRSKGGGKGQHVVECCIRLKTAHVRSITRHRVYQEGRHRMTLFV